MLLVHKPCRKTAASRNGFNRRNARPGTDNISTPTLITVNFGVQQDLANWLETIALERQDDAMTDRLLDASKVLEQALDAVW